MSDALPQDEFIAWNENHFAPGTHASVVYENRLSAATGKRMPCISVTVIDQYRYQREFSIGYHHTPGDSSRCQWEWSVYRHPGRRAGGTVSAAVAKRFMVEFLRYVREYPTLLFNPTGDHAHDSARPRCEGFVRLAEMLHDGAELSVKLLSIV